MKRYLLIILTILLALSPTLLLIAFNIMPSDLAPNPIFIKGTFKTENGKDYDFSNQENKELALFLQSLNKNSYAVDQSITSINHDTSFSARIDENNATRHIDILASLASPSYYVENGSLYQIEQEHFDKFLNTEFAISIYEALYTPALNTYSNKIVAPKDASFTYLIKNGEELNGQNTKINSTVETFYVSDTSTFSFSTVPSDCKVKAFLGNTLIFDGNYNELANAYIPKTQSVTYQVEARWDKSSNSNCFGNAKYEFKFEYAPAPSFSIDRTSLEAGEFLLMTAKNIQNPDEISFTLSNGTLLTPQFFEKGSVYYALIPFDKTLSSGVYDLTITCKETKTKFDISITARDRSASSKIYTPDIPLTEQMLSDMHALIASIGKNCSQKTFGSNRFINYETSYEEELYLNLGFGRVRKFDAGLEFELTGIEFTASVGVNVHVINSGIVCASGEDAVLGKYIVVDHGYGLKSWYCNISEALHSVGDEVAKDEIIAKTGNSAFHGYKGLYLMTTVFDTPVSPYAIYEKYFVLP